MPENQYAVNGNCTGLTPTSDCPFNFWRTSGDPEPGWGTIMRELNALRTVQNQGYGNDTKHHPRYNADPPRSRPGGWAYPGTMVVGDGSMTKDENRVHFGVSDSPSVRLLRVTQTGQWLLCDLLHCIPAVRHASYSASEINAAGLVYRIESSDLGLQPQHACETRSCLGYYHQHRGACCCARWWWCTRALRTCQYQTNTKSINTTHGVLP
jgi:hypothetical protein